MESVQALNGKGSRTTRSWASILNRSSSLTKVSEYAFVHRTCNNPVLFSRSLKKSICTMIDDITLQSRDVQTASFRGSSSVGNLNELPMPIL